MNLKDYMAFCDQWLAAWTGNRPDYLLSFYSENAYYQDPAYFKGLRGHQEILAYFTKLLAKNPDWRWEREEIFASEKGFILKWRASISGKKIIYGLDIVEVINDKITRNEVYFDTALLR